MGIEHWSNPLKGIKKTLTEHSSAVDHIRKIGQWIASNSGFVSNGSATPFSMLDKYPPEFGNVPAVATHEPHIAQAGIALGNLRRLSGAQSGGQRNGEYGFIGPDGNTVGHLGAISIHPEHRRYNDPKTSYEMLPMSGHPIVPQMSHFYGSDAHPIAKDASGRSYVTVIHYNHDGNKVPLTFWCSSGEGKKEGTPVGKWYFSPGQQSAQGWLAKLSEPYYHHKNNYGSPVLQFYADQLNKLVGNVSAPKEISGDRAHQYHKEFNPLMQAAISPIKERILSSDRSVSGASPGYSDALASWIMKLTDPRTAAYKSVGKEYGTPLQQAIGDMRQGNGGMEPFKAFCHHINFLREHLKFPVAKSLQKSWFNHAIWPGGK